MAGAPDDTIQTIPTDETPAGQRLAGRYRFVRLLGRGGTGHVYLAHDPVLDRQVAIKTILPAFCGNREVCRRIERECRLHAAIGVHPNIVTLHDRVEEQGRIHLVMEYVDGPTLAGLLAGRGEGSGGLPVAEVLDIVNQLLDALACIHGHGIVHRDIKTSNLLLHQREGGGFTVRLMDFGIARQEDGDRLTRLDTQGPGTPAYMAPERIDPRRYGATGPATDLYSVGVILYEMLAGAPPFTGTITEVFSGHLTGRVDMARLRPGLSGELKNVVARALEKEPERRFADAPAFQRALAAVPEAAAPDAPERDCKRDHRSGSGGGDREAATARTLLDPLAGRLSSDRNHGPRRRLLLLAAGLGLLSLLVLIWWHYRDNRPVPEPVPQTDQQLDQGRRQDNGMATAGSDLRKEEENTASALKVLESRRGAPEDGSAAAGKGREAGSDWEIIEVRDRKVR